MEGFFRPRFWPTVLTALMLVVLVGLGTWQVQRLHWKEQLIATIDARIHQAPVSVSSLPDAKEADYRPATTIGVFQHDKTLYLLSLSLAGLGGYHVLTPLQLTDGGMLLVDRGWIPYDKRNKDYARPPSLVSVTGIVRLPQPAFLFQSHNDAVQNNWYGIDLPAMAKATGFPEFLPYVLELDATPNESGYPVGGQTRVELPNNHFGYAVTWYGLALVLLVIYVLSSFRKNAED